MLPYYMGAESIEGPTEMVTDWTIVAQAGHMLGLNVFKNCPFTFGCVLTNATHESCPIQAHRHFTPGFVYQI